MKGGIGLENTRRIEGIIPALITPFLDDGAVDQEGVRGNVEYLSKEGVAGVLCNGSTGEGVTLSREERVQAIQAAHDGVKEGVFIIAATGAPSTQLAVSLSKDAEQAGCDMVLVVPPFYERPSGQGIVKHYAEIAEAINIPIILYNAPQHTGYALNCDNVENVISAQVPLVGMKDASGNLLGLSHFIDLFGDQMSFLSGCDDLLLPSFACGATGAIIALASFAPSLAVSLFRLARENQMERATKLHYTLLNLVTAICPEENFPARAKEAVAQLGMVGGAPRLPILPITQDESQTVRKALLEAGLLVEQ